MTTYHKIKVEDCNVFYREAGSSEDPAVLLLHGFPSASHMFRELMPLLADKFHLIAPDFPSFGQTESPSREEFEYSFDHLARIVDKFTEAVGLTKFAMYVFDYGAPIGYRLAMWHPERITAIVSQNGNISHHCLLFGVRTTHRSFLQELKPSSVTCPKPKYTLCRVATSLWRATTQKLPD